MKSTDRLLEINQRNATRVFLIDSISGKEFTYEEVFKNSLRIANVLRQKDIGAGDRILLTLNNSSYFVHLYFACLYSGVTVVPVNPVLSTEQKKFIAESSKSKLIIFEKDTKDAFDSEYIKNSKISFIELTNAGILYDLNKEENIIDFNNLESTPMFEPFSDSNENDELIIVYTSGTTSDPKGVVHSIKNIVTNASLFNNILGISKDNRFYNNLAMTYLGGYYNLLLLPFIAEGSVVLNKTFNPVAIIDFWKPIIENKVNTLWIVPTVISILNNFDRGNDGKEYCKNNIEIALTGTAPLYENVRMQFERKYGIRLIENYALSETLFLTTEKPNIKREIGSVGEIINGIELRVITKSNNLADENEEGEVQVRTPSLMTGYYNPLSKNYDLLLEDKWFSTGDIGLLKKNTLFITGRKKDLIIRGGINISPAAIETTIYNHISIEECAVIGTPNQITGEDIVVVVKLLPGYDLSTIKSELVKLCKEKLSSVQQPSNYFEIKEFPKTSSGKIQKGKIRLWVQENITKNKNQNKEKKEPSINPAFFKPSNTVNNVIEAVSIRYNNLVYDMQREGKDITVLSLGEAFFDIPLFRFDDLPMPALYHYTHSRGVNELRENLLGYFQEHYEVSFDHNKEIIVTAGSKIAIHMALMAILNPGDEVIIHEPAWVSYPEQIKLCYGVPVQVPYYDSVYDFEKYISNRTKLIIVNNPNNPSGKVLSIDELNHLNGLAKKYNLFILSDEAYSDFILKDEQFISLGNLDREFSHSIVVNSISKNYGISGWRLGYVISNEKLISQILKINQHLITCPPTILQFYIAKHFREIIKITKPQIIAVVEKRAIVLEYVKKLGLSCLEGSATFYLFLSISPSNMGSEEFCMKLLTEKQICVVPGIGYGESCDSFVRLSIGTESIERVKKGIDEIKEFIKKSS